MHTAFATPIEESMTIMDRARSYISTADHPLPWSVQHITDIGGSERTAKIKEIEEQLGIFPDGNVVPLTLRQKYFFKDSLSKLTYKVQKVRRDCREIVEVIKSFHPWEHDIKNTRLIRHFILECLSPFKRKTLQLTNATYDEYPTGQSSWFTYIGSWIFISGILIFFIYWIFAWGIYQGGDALNAWGSIYGTTAATDILLVQVTKIYILYYLPSQAMQPQLIRIRKVLADISMKYINKNDVSDLYHKNKVISSCKSKNDLRDEISVVQHMSAACRAAWSHELKDLPSSWLLRQVRTDLHLTYLNNLLVCRCRIIVPKEFLNFTTLIDKSISFFSFFVR